MATTIGKLSLVITGTATGLNSTIDASTRKLQAFARTAALPAAAANRALAGIDKAITSFTTPVSNLLQSIPFIGGALAAVPLSAGGFLSWIKQGVHEISEMKLAADRAGVSMRLFSTLSNLPGISAEHIAHSMQHLARELGNVNAGAKMTAGGLKKLGEQAYGLDTFGAAATDAAKKFERLGLNAKQLASGSVDQAFLTIANRIASLPTYAEKATAAFQIFGRAGGDLIPVLNRGAAGIQAMSARLEKMGIVFGDKEAARVREAAVAMATFDKAIKGIQIQLAIQLAPLITKLTDWLTKMGTSGKGMGDTISEALQTVAVFATSAFKIILRGIQEVAVAGIKLKETLSGKGPAASFGEFLRHGKKYGADETSKAVIELKKSFGAIYDALDEKKVQRFFASMRQGIKSVPVKAGEGPGLADFGKIADQMEEGARIIEEMQTPWKKFENTLLNLNDLVKLGAIDWGTYRRSVSKAFEDLPKMEKMKDALVAPTVAEVNTQAGYAALVHFQLQGQTGKPQNEVVNRLEQIREIQKQQLEFQKQLFDTLKRAKVAVIDDLAGGGGGGADF